MKPQGHEEIYRVAHQTAISELADITAEFERLVNRKDQLEKLMLAIKPLLEGEEQPEPVAVEESEDLEESEPAETEETEPVETPVFNADPFQRRIDHILGIGGGIRDVRKYSRQF